jgi:hypothetical protein
MEFWGIYAREDGLFDADDAFQAPAIVGDLLDEVGFEFIAGGKGIVDALSVDFIDRPLDVGRDVDLACQASACGGQPSVLVFRSFLLWDTYFQNLFPTTQ